MPSPEGGGAAPVYLAAGSSGALDLHGRQGKSLFRLGMIVREWHPPFRDFPDPVCTSPVSWALQARLLSVARVALGTPGARRIREVAGGRRDVLNVLSTKHVPALLVLDLQPFAA